MAVEVEARIAMSVARDFSQGWQVFLAGKSDGRVCRKRLALRERLKEEIRTGKIKGKRPTLRPLLDYAVAHGLVKNEGFSQWQNRGVIRSRARVEMEKIREA